jgi:hypothetical protein
MDLFVRKHQKKINGTLGCFDRMLFRGYLPIQSGWMMAEFLKQNQISFQNLKGFLIRNADRINRYAKAMAGKQGRPFQYLTTYTVDDWKRPQGRCISIPIPGSLPASE